MQRMAYLDDRKNQSVELRPAIRVWLIVLMAFGLVNLCILIGPPIAQLVIAVYFAVVLGSVMMPFGNHLWLLGLIYLSGVFTMPAMTISSYKRGKDNAVLRWGVATIVVLLGPLTGLHSARIWTTFPQ